RRLRIRLAATIFGMRARLAADVQAPLGFTVVLLELAPLDRPVGGEAVERPQTQVLLAEPVAGAAPVQRQAPHCHRPPDDAPRLPSSPGCCPSPADPR